MPKNRGHTAAGKIEHYLRGEGNRQEFTIEQLASKFSTSEANVSRIMRELRINGWTINQKGYSMRNVTKPRYIALQPGEKLWHQST